MSQQTPPPQGPSGGQPPQGQPPAGGPPPQGQPPGQPPAGGYYGAPPPGYGSPPKARLGKGAIIGIAVGAIVLLGAVGIAVAAGSGGDEQGDIPVVTGGGGQPAPEPTTAQAPTPSGTLAPSPVATGAPPPPPPTEQPTQPVPEPTATAQPSGETVQLQGGLTVPVPEGWDWDHDEANNVAAFWTGDLFVLMTTATMDPAAGAAGVLAENQSFFFSDAYSNLQVGEVEQLPPVGAMTSFASQLYQATWTGQQGSADVIGRIWVANRPDGVILGFSTEIAAGSDADLLAFTPVLDPTFESYAGVTFRDALALLTGSG